MKKTSMKNRLLLLALGWLLTHSAQAQIHEPWLPSAAAVRAALEAAPLVAEARARQDGASARAEGLRAGSAEFVLRGVGQQRSVRDPAERFGEGQLALERPLRLWGKAEADASLAQATLEQSDIAVDDAEHESARQMLALWFNVLRSRQASAAVAASARLASELVELTGKRVRAGDAAAMDLEIAQAEAARAQAALAAAQSAQGTAEAQLRARFPALGMPAGLPSLPALPASPASWLDAAARERFLKTNHALRLALADEAIAQRSARRSELEKRPDPTVGAFVMVERGGAERIAGVSVSMPLGSTHRRANATAAAADAQAAARRRAGVEQAARAEFDVLAGSLSGLEQAARAQLSALALEQSAAERAERAYAAGEIGIGQLLVLRRALADSLLASQGALINALEAQQKLRLDLHEGSPFDSHQ